MSRQRDEKHSARRGRNTAKTASRNKYRINRHRLARTLFVSLFVMGVAITILLHYSDHSSASTVNVSGNPQVQKEVATRPAATVKNGSGISGKVIVIDPGHGGFDCGAIGTSGLHEDDLNLEVAECLQSELIQSGAQVIMTRKDENAIAPTKDEDMEKRRQIIVDSHSDIVVSIHMNSNDDPNITGHVIYFMQNSIPGEELAKAIDNCMDQSLDHKRKNSVQSNDYFILKSGTQPCVLVECGFISSPEEESDLKDPDYQEQLAEAILDGIVEYFESDV